MSAPQVFRLPDLGEGLTEAEVLGWKVAVGDAVAIDQVVVVVETAKAAVEVPCPYAGVVVTLHAEAGQALPVGQPLISVEGADAKDPVAQQYREDEPAGSGNVLVGYGTGAARASRRRPRVSRSPEPQVPARAEVQAVRVISPVVRRLARGAGIDLTRIQPSGGAQVIRRADVERAIAGDLVGAPDVSVDADAAAGAAQQPDEIRTPLRGVRRTVADKLSRSRREIPEATIWVDTDFTALLRARQTINSSSPDRQCSLLSLLARICVVALQRHPELNATFDAARGEIVQHRGVHLGVAAQTTRGLVVPVVRDAQALTTLRLAKALAETTVAARAGTLAPTQLSGGTFTLNNYGVFGVDGSTPIINLPEVAILGVGRIIDRPWAAHGELTLRAVAQLTLAFDHRVCDGGTAGGFLRLLADYVEEPTRLLGEL